MSRAIFFNLLLFFLIFLVLLLAYNFFFLSHKSTRQRGTSAVPVLLGSID